MNLRIASLAAAVALSAGTAHAETMTLSVFAGTDTTATAIYQAVGGSTAVTADTAVLNADLASHGFGAYSFADLGGSSNNAGTNLRGPTGGAYVLASGDLLAAHGGTGAGTPITVLLSEGGFVLPTSSSTLETTATAVFAGALGSQGGTGLLRDATGAVTPISIHGLLGSDIQTAATNPGPYLTPFALETVTTLSLSAVSTTVPGSNGWDQKVQVQGTVAEPMAMVLMLIGLCMPLWLLRTARRFA